MGKRRKRWIWLMWFIVWPTALILVYESFGLNVGGHVFDYILFILLTVFVSLFPIHVRGTDIFFSQGISLVVFLQFGLFAEIILQQIVTLTFLIFLRVGRRDMERYPLNLLMFFAVSLVSGLVYLWAGGRTGSPDLASFSDFVPVILYVVTVFVSNHFFLYAIRRYLVGRPAPFLGKDVWWEAATTLLLVPIALVLYLLYKQIGFAAILFVGIPFICLSAMLRLYHSSEKINSLLQRTSEVGRQLSERLQADDTLDFFIEKLTTMFPIDIGYIVDAVAVDSDQLKLVRQFGQQKTQLPKWKHLEKGEGISGQVWSTGTAARYASRKQWINIPEIFLPDGAHSVISVPMQRNQEVVGIITLASIHKRMYKRHHLMILEILANFLAVAIENAKNYEETKQRSERDPLTNLYNYRYFSELLESMFQLTPAPFPLSIILIDLDHFKEINDTYGHEAGNEVLRELAKRLVNLIGDRGTVSRYGGEEFVIVLGNTNEESCLTIAEDIRRKIGDEPFLIDSHTESGHKTSVHVTASIGIATTSDHDEDSLSLIRNADRAMYTGAKQKGKNRVASYIG